ncbi:hypothetical protein GH733_014539 [Mirounga leonina]|nr:hypothetical protein GH733_014539 [Mirounga leonina]
MEKGRLPHSCFMLLLLVLLSTDASDPAERSLLKSPPQEQYVVLVPSLLHTGTPEKGCLLLSYPNETVTVSASLESLGGNQSLFTDLVVQKDLFHCVSFTLPRISSSSEVAFLTVQIKGPTQDFRKKNTVLVKNAQSLVFVQTDKPIYKPGQTGIFHWYTLRTQKEIELDNGRVSGWRVASNSRPFPSHLSPFRVLTRWWYRGIGRKDRTPLHLLPKFEVKVQVPKIISILDEKVNISFLMYFLCDTYTYGKPVPGLATVSMCRKLFHPTYCQKPEFCEKFTQQVNLVFTGNGTSEITNIVTRLKFVKVDSHFRRGIPFFGQVLLVDGKDAPIPNKLVFISANEANYLYNATTNDQGLVQFSINTTNILANKISVMAYHTQPDLCFNSVWLREEHQAAQHIAKHAFSLHGNYVHLERVAGTLPCGQTQIIKAYYILNGNATGEPKELIFYYLIMTKGNIVRSGTHAVPIQLRDSIRASSYSPQFHSYNIMSANNMQSPEPISETVRTYFPETWIWDLVVVDSSGVAEVGVTVPDTITECKAGALCLSNDTGLGLSLPASLRAFQPFFVELTMPYRGEAFTLKATVLNYLPKCIWVSVELKASPAFLQSQNEKGKESYCICANERQTLSWTITPKTLGNVNFSVCAEAVQSPELCGNEVAEVPEIGRKETVVKILLVEPEGIEQEKTFNSMTCTSGTEISEQLSLKLPPNVVKESARASFSVLGDILGSAVHNIQNLLQMPYGCGEQNMVLFAPNIYVLNYLKETQQLTPEIKSKALGYLTSGELTAFVLKTFSQAQTYIIIDEAHITQALMWLSQRQKDNGCFRSSGSLLNNAIKGGVEDEVTLSAYITIALLEIPLPVTHPVIRNALFCLETAWNTAKEGTRGSHSYTKALWAYAFALVGNQDKKREILNSLDEEAVKEDNSVHWERPQKPRAPVGHFYQPPAPSAEVEMTSYVLLAYLKAQPAPTSKELTSASRIMKWITKQQDSQGGFSSTQDTVVVLQALTRYGTATFTGTEKAAQVTIQNSQAFVTNLQVDNSNLLLLHQVSLPELPGEYSITVTDTSMKYNILPEKEDSPFALKVQTVPHTCDAPKVHTNFQISLNVSYTNMMIVDVKMVSGFIPLKPTVKMLERSSHVSRIEVSNNHVLIYVEQVTNQTLSFSFMVLQDIPVRHLKPVTVKVYDYYETVLSDESAIAEYITPCSVVKRSHARTTIIPH